MPLLDHFHAPLYPGREWESFHAVWAVEMVRLLNQCVLPAEYCAAAQIHFGSRVEADVATLGPAVGSARVANGNGGVAVAVAPEVWAPPIPALVMPTVFPDEIEVKIFGTRDGMMLVAAIELVSEGNKDRPETRRNFAAKCASYLQAGVGLVVIDIVTSRRSNLHDELVRLLEKPDQFLFPGDSSPYAVSYRPARRDPGGDQIDIWTFPLALGQVLPTVPLGLLFGPTVPLDLDTTYLEACRTSRL